ncbi:hypothetical protein BB31_27815 [Amycolatopsis lurida NRRL 2430]|uniref:Uncharacterized protein n=1 Tax=Amycolatopsis lurida NRRL 2430 TaxID=1460371 RepID=A0A2P2FMN5_AMYLU|nr:hypothetical protein BB31_27815 [Amycolatopsis lurida NRRL 2430]
MPDLPPNVRFVDFSGYFCTVEICHMSTMSAIAEKAVTEALGWGGRSHGGTATRRVIQTTNRRWIA